MVQIIYVRLLDEGVEVFRPVQAKKISSNDSYFILKEPDNIVADDEVWEFRPGSEVKVKEKDSDGVMILVASSLIH